MPDPYEGSYSGTDEEQIMAWVAEVTKQPAIASDGQWPESLRDGVALCELANVLRSGSVARINRSAMPFPQRENIKAFIEAVRALGVDDRDNFDTSDLFEDKNLNQVRICLINLGRAAYNVEGYGGPCLGKPIAAGRGGGKHARVETTGLWGKAGGEFGTADRPTAGSSASGAAAADVSGGIVDAVSTEWRHDGPAAEGTAAALAEQIASMAPEANRAERDAANVAGVDASAVAADHIALDLSATIGISDWKPCMVKKGTFLQGMLTKLPSKRKEIHGWQTRFIVLKDKELRYYEKMEDAADNMRKKLTGNYGKAYEVLFVKDVREIPEGKAAEQDAIGDMPMTFETEEESASDSTHEFHVDTGQRVIYMRASSAEQKLEWMKALNVKYTPPGVFEDEEAMPETPRDEDLATSAGVMAAEYAPCVIRTGAAAPQLRSRLELLVKKKIGGGWQERWVLLQGEILMAFDTEAALNNVVERMARNDPAAHHGANPARCLVVHDVVPPPAASGAFENENDKFEFHIDCEVVGKDANGDPVSGVGTHRLFFLRARNLMEKQQWLHTLNAARFPELPPEGIPIGKGGGMGMVGGAYRGLDEKEEGMAKRLAREEEERLEEEARHGKAQYDEKGQRVGYENPKGVRGVKHNFGEGSWMGMESLEGNGGNALTLEERLAAKEKERLERLAEKEKAAEEEEARKARGEEAKKDFLAKKREEQERAKTIQAAIAASKREPEPEPELEPEVVVDEWVPPPAEEPEPARQAGIAGRFPDECAALEQAKSTGPGNLVAQVFESEVLNMMGSAKAKQLLSAIRTSYEQPDACDSERWGRAALGCFISAAEDYRKLQPFLDQLIRAYFGCPAADTSSNVPLHVGPDAVVRGGMRPSWEVEGVLPIEAKTAGPKCGARLRFDRNIKGGKDMQLLAAYGDDEGARKALEERIREPLEGAFSEEAEGDGGAIVSGRYYSLTTGHENFVTEQELEELRSVADGMCLPDLVDEKYEPQAQVLKLGGVLGCWPEGRGFWLADDRSVAVWVGAREHITLLVGGACKASEGGMAALLSKGRGLLERLQAALGDFASHGEYGFVSTHPPNLGTGLRATARIALPTISKRGKDLSALSRAVEKCGLALGSQSGETFAGMEKLPRDGKCEVWRIAGPADADDEGGGEGGGDDDGGGGGEGEEGAEEGDGGEGAAASSGSKNASFGVTEGSQVEALWSAVEELLALEAKAKSVNAAAAKFYS